MSAAPAHPGAYAAVMGRVTRGTPTLRVQIGSGEAQATRRPDTVAVEEPLAVRVGGEVLTVTMRTPGDDFLLTLGLLHAEGLIDAADEVAAMMHCVDTVPGLDGRDHPTYNVVDVTLRDPVAAAAGLLTPVSSMRSLVSSSACGLCGTASIDAIRQRGRHDLRADAATWPADALIGWPEALRAGQNVFDRTGGVHAAALIGPGGAVVALHEDVGRHNAVDKVIGAALHAGAHPPLRGHALVVSARAGFELVQKAYLAGIPLLAAVGAPSSLAIDLAEEVGMTLVGFLRPPRFVVYAGAERIIVGAR